METKNKTFNWWYCDNFVHPRHQGQIGLLYMGEPRVFILIRDDADCYFSSFEEFKEHLAEVHFFYPEERDTTNIDRLLTDAWNFMSLQEEANEEGAEEYLELFNE